MSIGKSRQRAGLRRRGFSLAEILVGLAIIGLLAAVLIPAVAGQISKGDATRAIQDIAAIRSGIEQFVADVHRYPSRLTHLTSPITIAQADVNDNLYPAGLVARWKGPYLARDMTGGYTTGFGAAVVDSLVKVTFGVPYVTLRFVPVTLADFERIDLEMDGAVDVANGVLRHGAGDTARFLAMPIQ
jgi:prepilin-type N-terminal cleavage/methylation domain-containing protein